MQSPHSEGFVECWPELLKQSRARSHLRLSLVACLLWAACAGTTSPSIPSDVPPSGGASAAGEVHVRFEPGQGGALEFGAIPWPDDLYLDRDGRATLAELPGTVLNDYTRALRTALPMLDGFGASTPIYFFLDGTIDPSSLPQSAEESVGQRASVFLIDADTGSPEAFQPVRVEMRWSPDAQRLALRPALGHPLTPGRRYAALVTRRVKDARGRPIEAAPKFAAVRDTTVPLADARLVQARAEYTPVLETLTKARSNLQREDIVAMAVFRVQTTTPDLDAARRVVRTTLKLPVASNVQLIDQASLDRALGVAGLPNAAPHDQLKAIVHGTLPSPNFVSATARTHGAWQRDELGQLQQKRTEDVPFTLFVAKGEPSQIVIYQHQRGRERSDAALIANTLASRKLSVLAIDAPFQGLRAKPETARGVDTRNRFTGSETPDRFGDEPGDFFGAQDTQGGLQPLHPFYVRDALRQGVVDLMTAVRFVEEGDLAALGAQHKFDVRRVGFLGEDVGAQMGVLLAPFEPKLQALALVAPSAFVTQGFWLGATEQGLFVQLSQLLGRSSSDIDYDADSPDFWPELTLFEMLAGRAEPLSYAAALRRAPVNVFLQMADEDETVANLATEALAVSLGATFLSNEPRYVGDLQTEQRDGEVISGNFSVDGDRVTRLLRVYEPADHQMLLSKSGAHSYEDPVRPPFQRREARETFDNPSEQARIHLADYFASFFACVSAVNTATSAIKCGAAVTAQ